MLSLNNNTKKLNECQEILKLEKMSDDYYNHGDYYNAALIRTHLSTFCSLLGQDELAKVHARMALKEFHMSKIFQKKNIEILTISSDMMPLIYNEFISKNIILPSPILLVPKNSYSNVHVDEK
jgi:hypothetical protein